MNYKQADSQLQGRNAQSRKLGRNTYLQRRGKNIAVMLHKTDIATYMPSGSVTLNTDGWRTLTTSDRLRGLGHQVYTTKGVWFLHGYGEPVKFKDGLTISKNGRITGAGKVNEKHDKATKAQAKAYAQLCADALPLDLPNGGDCWFCHFQMTGSSDHLDSHMSEGYVVPSLIFKVLETKGSKASLWGAFHMSEGYDKGNGASLLDHARDVVKRTMRRYMLQAKGYQA